MPDSTTSRRRRPKPATTAAAETPAAETPEAETPEAETPAETPETLPAVPETPEAETPEETPEETPDIGAMLATAVERDGDTYRASETVDPAALAAEIAPHVASLAHSHASGEGYVRAVCTAIARVRSLIFLKGKETPDWAGKSWAAREYTRIAVLDVARAAFESTGMSPADAEGEAKTLSSRLRKAMERKYLAPVITAYVASLPEVTTDPETGELDVTVPERTPEAISAGVVEQYHSAGMLSPGEKRNRNSNSVDPAKAITPAVVVASVENISKASGNLPQTIVGQAILRMLGEWFQTLRKDDSFRGADGQDRVRSIAIIDAIADLADGEAQRFAATLTGDDLTAHYAAVEAAAVTGIPGKDPNAQ